MYAVGVYNDEGEPLGIEYHHEDAPDVEEYYEREFYTDSEPADMDECIAKGSHGDAGTGTTVEDVYECDYCNDGYFHLDDEGNTTNITKAEFALLTADPTHTEG